MYLGDVEPVLREGMDFLRDQGRAIGCYANRYMSVVCARRHADRKILRHELVEKPGRRWSDGPNRTRPMSGSSAPP